MKYNNLIKCKYIEYNRNEIRIKLKNIFCSRVLKNNVISYY